MTQKGIQLKLINIETKSVLMTTEKKPNWKSVYHIDLVGNGQGCKMQDP